MVKECRATVMGYCLSEVQGGTACDTQAGECVHEDRPERPAGLDDLLNYVAERLEGDGKV
jgi:hypothetical protein